jgi:hypothetical protein
VHQSLWCVDPWRRCHIGGRGQEKEERFPWKGSVSDRVFGSGVVRENGGLCQTCWGSRASPCMQLVCT